MSPRLGRVRRRARAHAGARSLRQRVDPLHERVHDGAGLRAEPRGDHHRHVPDGDRRAAHADDRGSRARAAGAVPRGAAVLRQGVSRVPARGRLLHDRIAPRPTTSSACRSRSGTTSGRQRALAQSARQDASRSSRCSTSRSRTRARSFRRARRGRGSRSSPIRRRSRCRRTIRIRRSCAKSSRACTTTSPTWTAQVGEILKQLEDDGLAENTIVFYWSDHGDGVPRAKRSLYDSGLRVPLMIRWPKGARVRRVTPGSVSDELVSFIDLAPTVLALAGVEIPAHLQGRVLVGPQGRAGARVRLRRARSHGHRIRHDALGARRRAFSTSATSRRSCPYAGHITIATRARSCRSGSGCRPSGKLTGPPALWMRTHAARRGAVRHTDRSASDSRSVRGAGASRHARAHARRRSPTGWRAPAIRGW